jgi:hypothetical protein
VEHELLSHIIAILRLRKESHVKYIQTGDNPPNGYAAVLIPDWQVKQWLSEYDSVNSCAAATSCSGESNETHSSNRTSTRDAGRYGDEAEGQRSGEEARESAAE